MKKRKVLLFILILLVVLIAVALVSIYFLLFNKTSFNTGGTSIKNPVIGKSVEQAVEEFDKSFVLYLLLSLGVQDLHPAPFSSLNPIIEISADDLTYNCEIADGKVIFKEGESEAEDIRIVTTKEEVVKTLKDKNYLVTSFKEGRSRIELVESKTNLALKGYLGIYEKFS